MYLGRELNRIPHLKCYDPVQTEQIVALLVAERHRLEYRTQLQIYTGSIVAHGCE